MIMAMSYSLYYKCINVCLNIPLKTNKKKKTHYILLGIIIILYRYNIRKHKLYNIYYM